MAGHGDIIGVAANSGKSAAPTAGLIVSPLSLYWLEAGRPGLYLAYASIPESALQRGVQMLAEVLREGICRTWP